MRDLAARAGAVARAGLLPAVLVAGAVVLVGGCAGHQSGTVGAGAAPDQTLPVGTPATNSRVGSPGPALPGLHLPTGATPVAGGRVDAAALPAGYPSLVWTLSGGRALGLYGERGGCQTVTAVLDGQTATQVIVHVIQRQNSATGPCPDYLAYQPVTVQLDAPLADRSVVLRLSIETG